MLYVPRKPRLKFKSLTQAKVYQHESKGPAVVTQGLDTRQGGGCGGSCQDGESRRDTAAGARPRCGRQGPGGSTEARQKRKGRSGEARALAEFPTAALTECRRPGASNNRECCRTVLEPRGLKSKSLQSPWRRRLPCPLPASGGPIVAGLLAAPVPASVFTWRAFPPVFPVICFFSPCKDTSPVGAGPTLFRCDLTLT